MSLNQAWMDEISLDPSKPWLRMGTRQLGTRPWLVPDGQRLSELALKHKLLAAVPNDVLVEVDQPGTADVETLQLVAGELAANQQQNRHYEIQQELLVAGLITQSQVVSSSTLSALDLAGRMIQEDLCLLERTQEGWMLRAASLCFPSRWRLADKINRPLGAVHGPVPGYQSALRTRVDGLLDRLGDTIVWRRNWFIHPDPSLHQPQRPPGGDPVISADRCVQDLTLRSERQTLRILPHSGWCLFTIRIQQAPLEDFLYPDHAGPFLEFLEKSSEGNLQHRGLSSLQVAELKAAEILA